MLATVYCEVDLVITELFRFVLRKQEDSSTPDGPVYSDLLRLQLCLFDLTVIQVDACQGLLVVNR